MLAVARIRLLTLGCVLVTALSVGGVSLVGFRDLVRQQQVEHVQSVVGREARALDLALGELWNDIRLIGALPLVEAVAQDETGSPEFEAATDQLAAVFERVLLAKPAYVQVRLIRVGGDGRELVRLDRVDDSPVRVRGHDLQGKARRDYHRDTVAAGPGVVYASAITLNREQGRVETPHRPMLRAAMCVADAAGECHGIVVINLELDRLVRGLGLGSNDAQSTYITNEAGDFLLHPDEAKRFGFDLGARWLAQDEFEQFDAVIGGASEVEWQVDDHVAYFRRVHPFPDPERFVILGRRASVDSLAFASVALVRQVVLTILILALALIVVSLWLGRTQTRPLQRMSAAVRALGRREAVGGLPTERRDEFGVLARAFAKMAEGLRHHEEELHALNAGLATANEDLEHFVHIAAHDLREPLRKLCKLVDLLEDEVEEDDEEGARELLGHVRVCTEQMLTMVDDFRALTRVGTMELAREDVDLERVADNVLAELAERLEARAVRIERDTLPTLTGYSGLLHQLYVNLIANALDHVREDGFMLRLTANQVGPGWHLGVLNSGSTISEEAAQSVFKLFRKGGVDSKPGTGVGLSLCKKIVERHRGRIWISAARNQFHVLFELEGHEDQAE